MINQCEPNRNWAQVAVQPRPLRNEGRFEHGGYAEPHVRGVKPDVDPVVHADRGRDVVLEREENDQGADPVLLQVGREGASAMSMRTSAAATES